MSAFAALRQAWSAVKASLTPERLQVLGSHSVGQWLTEGDAIVTQIGQLLGESKPLPLTDPHSHILHRLHEDVTTGNNLNPSYATNDGQTQHGDSSLAASHTKKEGEEFVATGEETREVELATKILQAAARMAKTPDVEQIIRLADELKKMHGKE